MSSLKFVQDVISAVAANGSLAPWAIAELKDIILDSDRYRWIREQTGSAADDAIIERCWEESWLRCGKGLDEAVDEAMNSESNHSEK